MALYCNICGSALPPKGTHWHAPPVVRPRPSATVFGTVIMKLLRRNVIEAAARAREERR